MFAPLAFAMIVAVCPLDSGRAQSPALAASTRTGPEIRYAANESGGRITITHATPDSAWVEGIRLQLLEMAASIRRGDFRKVRVIQLNLPAIKVLEERRQRIRCTFRATPRGGELVLLSDDEAVVKAIHQILAAEPPELSRS